MDPAGMLHDGHTDHPTPAPESAEPPKQTEPSKPTGTYYAPFSSSDISQIKTDMASYGDVIGISYVSDCTSWTITCTGGSGGFEGDSLKAKLQEGISFLKSQGYTEFTITTSGSGDSVTFYFCY